METPCFLATADAECVGCKPSGTGRHGRAVGCGGMDSRLRAALAEHGVTPFNPAT